MTKAQQKAFKWLTDRGGDAAFDKHGVALAMGETAPHDRSTWNALEKMGKVQFYNPHQRGRGRVRVAR